MTHRQRRKLLTRELSRALDRQVVARDGASAQGGRAVCQGGQIQPKMKVSSNQSNMRAKASRPAPIWQCAPAPPTSGRGSGRPTATDRRNGEPSAAYVMDEEPKQGVR
jgi:hypothetical protein